MWQLEQKLKVSALWNERSKVASESNAGATPNTASNTHLPFPLSLGSIRLVVVWPGVSPGHKPEEVGLPRTSRLSSLEIANVFD